MSELVERVICPTCKKEMEGRYWDTLECEGDCCWQKVTFQCPNCKFEKRMNSVYEWIGFEERDYE